MVVPLSGDGAKRMHKWAHRIELTQTRRGGGRDSVNFSFQRLSAVLKHYRSPYPINKV
jgi:hypothetical protein